MKRRFKYLKEPEYKQLKALFDAGISVKGLERTELTTRTYTTLKNIKRSTSYEDYKEIIKPKVVETNNVSKMVKPVSNEYQYYAQMITLLAEINKSMAFLVKRIEVVEEQEKSKKKWSPIWN
jgi:hypothetical protein